MEEIKNKKLYIFLLGIVIGVTSTCIAFSGLYNIDIIYEELINKNDNFINKNNIEEYLNNKDEAIVKKDSYILKSNFDKYILEYTNKHNSSIIKNIEVQNMKQLIHNLQKQNADYSKLIISLKSNKVDEEKEKKDLILKKWNENLKKIEIQEKIKQDISSPIYFIANSIKMDIESLKKIERIKDFEKKNIKKLYISPCANKLEGYNKQTSFNRIINIKNILLNANINPRKIIIKKDTLSDPSCFDDESEEIKNEKNDLLVIGSIIRMDSY
ncbi:hypothetical protein [Arcobacter arenosus]|uniref:hypothetical protein n=1 Tax=Arcobacter arenosus TaxID=2576037 RepID=UPI003BA8994C